MPNHVHVIFQPMQTWTLAKIIHSWKSFTVHRANKLLGRAGEFWQRESYDHLIRDSNEMERISRYIANNPAKAKLGHWAWVG